MNYSECRLPPGPQRPLPEVSQQRLSVADRDRQGIYSVHRPERSRHETTFGAFRVEVEFAAQFGKGDADGLSSVFQPAENGNGAPYSPRLISFVPLPVYFRRQVGDLISRMTGRSSPSVQ